jgi:hypothetical protein
LKVRGLLFLGRSLPPELRGSPQSSSHRSISIESGLEDEGKGECFVCFASCLTRKLELTIAFGSIRQKNGCHWDSLSLEAFLFAFN